MCVASMCGVSWRGLSRGAELDGCGRWEIDVRQTGVLCGFRDCSRDVGGFRMKEERREA